MNLQQYCLKSLIDPTWINNKIAEMGEEKFWHFKNKVYKLLDDLKVGESMLIDEKWDEKNIEFYVKISCYYISQSNCCYSFTRDYTAVKRQFDNKKINASIDLLKKNREIYKTKNNYETLV